MKLIVVVMTAGVVGVAFFVEHVSEPAAWAILLAGVAGSGFVGRGPGKNRMGIED